MIKLEQYRDIWLSEKIDEVIGFYPREFYPFDNFSSFKVEWNGYLYSSVEEAYQAASFMGSDEELVEKVKHSHSADEAQRIARPEGRLLREEHSRYLPARHEGIQFLREFPRWYQIRLERARRLCR